MHTTDNIPDPWYSRRINVLLAKVDDEAERLSGFRRAEAAALALTKAEIEELTFLRNYEDHRELYEAAPDLLAALEGLLPDFEAYLDPVTEPDPEILERNRAWVDDARAAIAKAKNSTPTPQEAM